MVSRHEKAGAELSPTANYQDLIGFLSRLEKSYYSTTVFLCKLGAQGSPMLASIEYGRLPNPTNPSRGAILFDEKWHPDG
jgi:hypothetical protein